MPTILEQGIQNEMHSTWPPKMHSLAEERQVNIFTSQCAKCHNGAKPCAVMGSQSRMTRAGRKVRGGGVLGKMGRKEEAGRGKRKGGEERKGEKS